MSIGERDFPFFNIRLYKTTNFMTKQESALDCIYNIKEKTDTIIIMCSLGKDSLVVLDLAYPHFKRIICVFMYFVKDLEHIQKWINWVKAKYPDIEFVQVPHWCLTYVLRSGLYCTPNPNIKLLTLKDVCKAMRKRFGVEYVFLGMKRADSMNRRLFLDTYKENHYENNYLVYPVADWTQKDIMSYMKMHQLPEPVRYGGNGRGKASGGIGFNLDFVLWCKEYCPNDLERFFKAFPLARRILLEDEYQTRQKEKEMMLQIENSEE